MPPLNIGALLARRAGRGPGLEAVAEVETGRRVTYAELDAAATRVAHALWSAGVRTGDRVALLLRNGVECMECYFAIARIGAVMVPLNWRLLPAELEFVLNDSGARLLIYDSEFDDSVTVLRGGALPVVTLVRVGHGSTPTPDAVDYEGFGSASGDTPLDQAGGDELLFIMYTSGTTGRPKGVMHTHETMTWASIVMNMTCDMRYRDRDLVALPFFHIGALLPITAILHRGGTSVLLRRFDAARVLGAFERERINATMLVTSILRLLLGHTGLSRRQFSTVRWIIGGGESLSASIVERYAELGVVILQDYGSTECGPVTIVSPEDAVSKAGSVGKPFFFTDVRLVNGAGRDVSTGHTGEIIVRGRHVTTGYWSWPDATAEAIRDGWFYTGDLASRDPEGYFFVQGRKKDLIISGGENIDPAEIEDALLEHPMLRDVAVIGQLSAKWGESPVAIVAVAEGERPTAGDLTAHCRERLAGYKVPKAIEFVDEIPRTPTGKAQKTLLRERFPGPAPE